MRPYGLYFRGIDDKEHVGDFDSFLSGHSQYLTFFLDGNRFGRSGDDTPFARLIFEYIFFY